MSCTLHISGRWIVVTYWEGDTTPCPDPTSYLESTSFPISQLCIQVPKLNHLLSAIPETQWIFQNKKVGHVTLPLDLIWPNFHMFVQGFYEHRKFEVSICRDIHENAFHKHRLERPPKKLVFAHCGWAVARCNKVICKERDTSQTRILVYRASRKKKNIRDLTFFATTLRLTLPPPGYAA